MTDELIEYKIERPSCGHLQTVRARKHQNLADYNSRLVPELREKLNVMQCEQCEEEKEKQEKEKAERAKRNLILQAQEKMNK